ncbi:YybH family protein [Pseudobacter ginsenosidimutans]|uniref:Ketosteroid isomerase-like protein n=1 Tax=Pseudobacter ginsenosidimutans TaxID=661488 RepID=A0A4Q7N480_9BACT|nr:DUF4440 domain-containing protein [Pseudobacter ginsenosidimutans]QEC44334.1 DUF4440 domain-containing protein [Pseudobacter ginsenosidimutans]RZS75799.1 ketosteroid isomerase-like protein [Pseudobacter ginsenosidimutans]
MQRLITLIPCKSAAFSAQLLVLFGFLMSAHADGKTYRSVKEDWQQKVEKLNLQFTKALEKGDVPAMMQYYAADAVSMPEHHATLFSPKSIADYYQRWLAATSDNRCKRLIYSVKIVEGFLLEAGTFTHDFVQAGHKPFRYSGKYIHVWRIGENKSLTLVGEIWGAASGFDRASLPLSSDNTSPVLPAPIKQGYSIQADSINHYNVQIAQLVKERNGAAFSAYYTNDAIYMPYYMPMVIGKDSIHQYYVVHEDPAVTIDTVQINMSRVLPAGDYALVNGFYRVNWRAGEHSGLVTGKSINIWKREQDGKWRLHWQMTNHD